jgi:hypothetical protein
MKKLNAFSVKMRRVEDSRPEFRNDFSQIFFAINQGLFPEIPAIKPKQIKSIVIGETLPK